MQRCSLCIFSYLLFITKCKMHIYSGCCKKKSRHKFRPAGPVCWKCVLKMLILSPGKEAKKEQCTLSFFFFAQHWVFILFGCTCLDELSCHTRMTPPLTPSSSVSGCCSVLQCPFFSNVSETARNTTLLLKGHSRNLNSEAAKPIFVYF